MKGGIVISSKKNILIVLSIIIILATCLNVSGLNDKKDKIKLTQEEMMEDYMHIWKTLEENSLILLELKNNNVDLLNIFLDYKEQIQNCNNEKDFFLILNSFLNSFNEFGHLALLDYWMYNYFIEVYSSHEEMKPWLDVLTNNKVKENYQIWKNIIGKNNWLEDNTENISNNVTTKILEKDRIAYINIKSFRDEFVDINYDKLYSFYKQIQEYPHLIIDITNNGGGSDKYWIKNIVYPNLKQTLSFTNFSLIKLTDSNKDFISVFLNDKNMLLPIKDLEMIDIEKNVLSESNYFFKNTVTLEKKSEPIFKGRIWVMIGERVYSSSDLFAKFCKDTGFATLVGETTKGNGAGEIDPIIFSLPNSKLIVRYDMTYSLNSDGTNNQTYGTTPDIVFSSAENPLNDCLKVINQYELNN